RCLRPPSGAPALLHYYARFCPSVLALFSRSSEENRVPEDVLRLARFMVWKLGIRAQLTFEGKSALFRGRAPRRGARDGRARNAGGSRAAATSTMAASASVAYPRPHASFASASPGVARR